MRRSLLKKLYSLLLIKVCCRKKLIIVNDHSTDNTESIIDGFTREYGLLSKINNYSSELHMPGSKVVQAFYKGLSELDEAYDFIVKFNADLFTQNYFERIIELIQLNPKASILGGFAYERGKG